MQGFRTILFNLIMAVAGLALAGCGGTADLLRFGAQQVQPTVREIKAETGAQDGTIFTMSAIGCYERLQDHRLERTIRLLQAKTDAGEPLTGGQEDLLAKYQDCVAAMRTTRERQPVIQFIQ
jgi:hypothetical protein